MGKITEEELAMLSDEERAAIADDTSPPSTEEIKAQEEAEATRLAQEAGAGAAQRADKKTTEKSDEEKEAEAALAAIEAKDKADAAAKEAAEKAAADAEAAAKVQAEKEAEDKRKADDAETARLAEEKKTKETLAPLTSGPPFVLEAEKKFGTPEEIAAKMTELDTKFEDGEIKLSEYNLQRAQYVEALTQINMFSTINAQVQKATAEKAWKDAQVDFFKNNSEYLGERLKNVAFVDAVNRLLTTEESKQMSDSEIFEAAKKECDAVFYPNGRPSKGDGKKVVDIDTKRVEAEEKKKAEEAEKAKALEAARKLEAEKAAGVKTLAKVPVSEANAGVDKYDIIDKLTGEAYEEAVAKMSDAERAIYAARG